MATNGLFQAHLDTDKAQQVENFRKQKKLSKSQLVRDALDAFIKPIKEEKEKSPKEKEEIKEEIKEELPAINLEQLIKQGAS
jgi:gas vesicle protein|tara:strand:+ start:247 stop:492 length:246 start_codon:yes stop_codon:yes gene_type:complete